MIRRLYVDNFRSLVDFTWEPGKETLVLGYNGSGKTSALEVVQILKEICTGGAPVDFLLGQNDLTLWRTASLIKFEIDIQFEGRLYSYKIGLGRDLEPTRSWPSIVSETLFVDGRQLFNRGGQRVQMNSEGEMPGTFFPVASHQSVISVMGSDLGAEEVVRFRERMKSILYLKPSPFHLYAHKPGVVEFPDEALFEMVPWYIHLSKDQAFVESLQSYLKGVWPELIGIRTPEFSPNVYDFVLEVKGDRTDESTDIPLRSLSDGERLLIALYVVASFQTTRPATSIIIDEPDNYVSLLELQPWLLTMLDGRPDDGQLILISHNPEIINIMGRSRVAWFGREDHLSPTKVQQLPADDSGLPLTELIARGWVNA